MKLRFKHLPFIVLASIVFLTKGGVVLAQVQPATPSAQVLQKESLQKEISIVRASYRGQLESYRQQQKAYQIAIDQYYKHQTLVSIEDSIRETKQLMEYRALVLKSYLTLLKLNLIEVEGVEISLKTYALEKLDFYLEQLDAHQKSIELATKREEVNQVADEFIPVAAEVVEVSHRTLSLIVIGKMQLAQDQAQVIYSKLLKESQEANISSARERSLNEIGIQMTFTQDLMIDIWKAAHQKSGQSFSLSTYQSVKEALDPAYVKLSQVLSYFYEYRKIK